ncbi:monosaccharide ABC transporter ATP-binding protein, CUT2 family [Pseudooceanicola antarcticus]|uniref:Monosaccharide ABC transporter ATP-binding protein, CUT2 family n=1 Tax=Pseudooceanicola antarcticus TaxID=1247613 RepID=A0A285JEA4_9RHOB|nr:sugar ABC transporter ATP-binding protein [Pseudooceanicola antarcticus]PJE31090.1 sugar ABC transporter ATP-binding protein [Pseudooceanicola antarcticus]SNY58592.1 monosaccharide ABC transporter ATP-binding protein, CUT2 family [Pseudooceanicola antarcticus]
MQGPIVELSDVSISFAGVKALEGVDFACHAGTTHAILGENGAGKSTLIKTISGVLKPDTGSIAVNGREVRFAGPAEAADAGIVCMFQELSLIPDLSVADNISLQRPPRHMGLIDRRAQIARAEALLARVRCEDVDPRAMVRDLSLSRRQMVEVAKALGRDPKVLILDEATSALTQKDVETIYGLLDELRADGVCSLFISHRMHEVEALCDRLSVFRNGRHVETFGKGERSDAEIVRLMIGRDVTAKFPPKPAPKEREPVIRLEELRWENRLNGVSLSLGKGEILGIGGLDGQGQKELLLALFGVLKGVEGKVTVGEGDGLAASPHAAKTGRNRIALIPEDRKTEGLMLSLSIADNIVAAALDKVSGRGVLDQARLDAAIAEGMERLQIKAGSTEDAVKTLSGGNQQKVVLAKWLMIAPDVILMNDPTRGIDVGTKQEIFRMMRALADEGKSILFYSSDYAELIGCSDRVIVLYDGRVVSELTGEAITEEAIVAASLNIQGEMA